MDNKKNVLGRGLDTLLPASRSAVAVAPQPTAMTGDLVKEIPVEQIDRNPYQTRTRFAEEAMNELAASIKAENRAISKEIDARADELAAQIKQAESSES